MSPAAPPREALDCILPVPMFSREGRTITGEKWSWYELLLPSVGCLIAIAFAVASFSRSNARRRLWMLVVAALAVFVLGGNLIRSITHW